jgi:hydroxylamine reductase (hybrid-cluster protein)
MKKNKMSLTTELDLTREGTAEMTRWCILIALLALGIRNIRLGPTLPPFLSPGVVRTLQERYGLKPIATPEADLRAILGH